MSVGLELRISIFQFFDSAYIEYILIRSAAKSAASSPPVPPRISIITFFSSLGSFGRRRIFNSSLALSIISSASAISRRIISSNSLSCPASSISLSSATVCFADFNSLYLSIIGVRSECSLQYLRHDSWSAIISGSLIFSDTS